MTTLLLVLVPIALLDATSIVPLAVVPLAAVVGGDRPALGAIGFLSGIFVVYVSGGVVLLFGLDALFDVLGPRLARWWSDPNTPELLFQIVLGAVMLAFAWKLASSRESQGERRVAAALSPGQGFALGAGLTLVGLPGALPYLGAIDQILRADLGVAASGFALVFYNVVFLLPLAALPLVRLVFPGRSEAVFRWVLAASERWGHRLIVGALVVIGTVLLADGIGWFLGYPLLPVDPSYSSAIVPQ